MFLKTWSRYAASVLGWVFIFSLCAGLQGAMAIEDPCNPSNECDIYGCYNDCLYTQEFNLKACEGFRHIGKNPYFILKPGYQLILEGVEDEGTPDETLVREEVTVLYKTKWIRLDRRWIKTRVVEERALEWDDGEWVVIEISLNWFAICKRTNDVYYFGEWSRDCENGFTEDEEMCEGEEEGDPPTEPVTTGSWEAGKNGAKPGIIMPGTFLLGAKYFQEIAESDGAVDRGENVAMGLTWPDEDGEDPEFMGCVNIVDTNPTEGVCGDYFEEEGEIEIDGDSKIYCPGVGLVQDEDLKLVCYGFHCADDDGDDDDDDDDDDEHKHRTVILP